MESDGDFSVEFMSGDFLDHDIDDFDDLDFDFEEFPPTYCLRPNCGRWDWRDGYCNHHWYLDAQNDSNF